MQVIGAVCSIETLVSAYRTTRHYNPEDQHQLLHRRENFKSRVLSLFYYFTERGTLGGKSRAHTKVMTRNGTSTRPAI